MAQIWVTFAELGDVCACSPQVVRAHAHRHRWATQTGRTGVTLVLLPDDLAHDFMAASVDPKGLFMLERVANGNVLALSCLEPTDDGGLRYGPMRRTAF